MASLEVTRGLCCRYWATSKYEQETLCLSGGRNCVKQQNTYLLRSLEVSKTLLPTSWNKTLIFEQLRIALYLNIIRRNGQTLRDSVRYFLADDNTNKMNQELETKAE